MNVSVSGNTLKSLRNRYKANLKGASKMTGIEESVLEKWENEGVELSISDAKKLANSYFSHWSVFLLKDKVKPIKDVNSHRAGYDDNVQLSTDTVRAYEVARSFLDASAQIEGQTVDKRILSLCQEDAISNPVATAHTVRNIMQLGSDDIAKVKGGKDKVYAFWVQVVSSLGIYVSELDMPEGETKAFLVKEKDRAMIAISKKDRHVYSKMFSLLHELGHLVKGEKSAACEFKLYANRVDKIETWCNRFASEVAAYDELVLEDERVNKLKESDDPAYLIRLLAIKFKVSFTVMMYKMKSHQKITDKQHKDMVEFYENVIRPREYYVPESDEIKLGKAYYISKAVKEASPLLTYEILERQTSGDITYSQAARLLNTKPRYLDGIKEKVGFGS